MIAMEYGVTECLLFGPDFPVRRPSVAIRDFRTMPRIESIFHELPLLGIEP